MIFELLITVKAYSPYDQIDKVYRDKHPIPITARGNDCREHPFGIACYLPSYPRGSSISVPGYNGNCYTACDDTGGITKRARGKQIEVRFPTEAEARRWGTKELTVMVFIPDKATK